jgi:hypothetical protein
MHCFLRSLLVVQPALLAGMLAAQGHVWVVDDDAGPGVHFQSIQSAVDAATDGDTLLIRTGNYFNPPGLGATVVLDGKGLTLIAEAGAQASIEYFGFGIGGTAISVRNLAVGQRCVLRGLRVVSSLGRAVEVVDCAGSVWIEGCSVTSKSIIYFPTLFSDAALYADGAELVMLSRSSVVGDDAPVDALRARDSAIIAYDTTFEGGGGPPFCLGGNCFPPANAGGAGVRLFGSFLLGSGCVMTGGQGASGCAMEIGQCCSKGGTGGSGLVLQAQSGPTLEAHVLDTVISGGAGGPGGQAFYAPSCSDGPAGAATIAPPGTLELIPGIARSLEFGSPIRAGNNAHVSYTGVPGDLVIAAFTLGFKGTWFPPFKGFLLPTYPPSADVLGSSASGTLALDVHFAQFPAGLEVLHVYAQAFAIGAGGAQLLGSPSELSVLNQAF